MVGSCSDRPLEWKFRRFALTMHSRILRVFASQGCSANCRGHFILVCTRIGWHERIRIAFCMILQGLVQQASGVKVCGVKLLA